MSTTTYVVATKTGYDMRTSGTMHYTHAVVTGDVARTWHLTEAAARKAAQKDGGTVTPVEAHQGSKAAVAKRLAAKAEVEAPKKAPAKKAPAKKAATGKLPVFEELTKGLLAPAKKAPAKEAPVKVAPAKEPKVASSSAPQGHPGHTWLRLMVQKGTSQTQTANAMGVAPMTLNRLVNGHGIPTAKVTVAFARAVDADVEQVWAEVAAYELRLALDAK